MSIKSYYQQLKTAYHIPWSLQGRFLDRQLERCPYCAGRQIIKCGRRRSRHETVQLYLCKSWRKTFTPKIMTGKIYLGPLKKLRHILDADAFRPTVLRKLGISRYAEFSRLAGRAPQHPKLRTYFVVNP